LRRKPRDLLLIFAITAAVWYAYFIDWVKPASSGSLTTTLLEHPVAEFHYVLLYLGAPAFFAGLDPRGADACGALALAGLLAGCIYAIWRRERHPRAIAMLAFAVFIAGNALLTASGRLWLGIESALASRYTTASLAGWLALILFAAVNVGSGRYIRSVVLVAVFAILTIVSYQSLALKPDDDVAYSRLVAGLALRAHVYDPAITNPIYPFPDRLTAISKDAEAAKLSPSSRRINPTIWCRPITSAPRRPALDITTLYRPRRLPASIGRWDGSTTQRVGKRREPL
jgi:hypothetical protein